jgi:hypothetical protein
MAEELALKIHGGHAENYRRPQVLRTAVFF